MSKLTRVFQQLFGRDGDASHFGQFGSKAAAAPIFTKDPVTIQALTAFTDGWQDAVNAGNKAPFLEDMNGLFLVLFRQLAYGFQEGVPEWDSGTTYFIGSIVKKTGTFELYGSLTDNNTGNALPNQTTNGNWQFLNPPSVAAGVMADFGGPTAPFGWLLCDGSVVAQASYPALFSAVGATWNTGGEGAGNFRLPDMRGYVGVGVGGGPLNLPLATKGGEATHTLLVGEIPAGLSVSDPGHSHAAHNNNDGGLAQCGKSQATIAGAAPGNFLPIANATDVHVTIDSNTTGIGVGGGGSSHNNVQPSAGVNKIIKF